MLSEVDFCDYETCVTLRRNNYDKRRRNYWGSK